MTALKMNRHILQNTNTKNPKMKKKGWQPETTPLKKRAIRHWITRNSKNKEKGKKPKKPAVSEGGSTVLIENLKNILKKKGILWRSFQASPILDKIKKFQWKSVPLQGLEKSVVLNLA